jgi:hypothetical protein
MATQGPLYPSAATNVSNAGTSESAEAWVNPTNVFSDNATEAAITAATYDSPDISQILVVSGFGFTIPEGATIDGITVEIDRRSIIASSGKDFRVQLGKGLTFASLVGSNQAVPATIWPSSTGVATYGGASSLWGATWTVDEVNASSFALFLSCQANIANADVGVDYIRATVTYTYVTPAGTKLYLRSASSDYGTGNNDANLAGSAATWLNASLSTSAGPGVASPGPISTVAGPTSGVEATSNARVFYSPPLDADVTISGPMTWNIWASENNASANVAINAILQVVDGATGTMTEIDRTARTTEVALTTRAVNNFSAAPASGVVCKRGDRLRVRVYADDAGTMATAFTFDYSWDGGTPDADGDTWVQLTESLTFASEPAGSQVFPTDTASAVSTASVDREAWTSRGAGVQSDVTNTVNGWTAPLQVTDTAGGTVVDWFTKELAAFTLGGAVRCNIRALESNGAASASVRAEVARVEGDGTSPTVWASGGLPGNELLISEAARSFLISGDDLAISDGQRLRIRVHIDDIASVPMVTGHTVTLFYAGTSGGASGDTYLTFTQTLTEFVAGPTYVPARRDFQQMLAH